MISWRRAPLRTPQQWWNCLVNLGVAAAGLIVLCVWNPVTQPGPVLCTFRRLVGLPCPTCGMTRGLALCLRGQLVQATVLNPLTLPALLIILLLVVKWSYECLTGTGIQIILSRRGRVLFVVLLAVGLLSNWCYLLVYRREESFADSLLGYLVR